MTPAQKKRLSWAAQRENGQFYTSGVMQKTVEALKLGGYIKFELAIKDEDRKRDLQLQLERSIQGAKIALADGEWKKAHAILSFAYGIHAELNQMAYFITDKGREACK